MSLIGNAGITFDLTEEDVTVSTGTITQLHQISSSVGDLSVSSTDIVYSIAGSVGTTAFDLNLNAVDNQSGTGYSTQVVRNNSGDFTSLKMIAVYNTHASNTLLIGSPAANSLFTWHSTSDQLSIPSGGCFAMSLSTALTIGSNGKLNIVGSSSSTTFNIFIFGA